MEEYQGEATFYRSCQAALSEVDRALGDLWDAEYFSYITGGEIKKQNEVLGYYSASSLCSPRAAFRLLLRSLSLDIGEDVAARLSQAGVPLLRSLKADLDGDKLMIGWWWWILLGGSGRSKPGYLSPLEKVTRQFQFLGMNTASLTIRLGARIRLSAWKSFPFPGERQPAIVLQVGETLSIFSVLHRELTAETQVLWKDDHVKSFGVDPQAHEIRIEFTQVPSYPGYTLLAWQEYRNDFLSIDPVERLLFDQGKPAEAIRAIQAEIAALDPDNDYYPSDAPPGLPARPGPRAARR